MGVLGLWKLLEPCGKPVPLESLEDKVLAVDVSIWLNQVIKGYRDGQNGALPNAHLMGVFHRVCKLLTYKIKPVFVFDGGVPALKRETLLERRFRKQTASQAAERTSKRLVHNLLRQEAMRAVLGAAAPLPLSVAGGRARATADPFQLPPPQSAQPEECESSSDSETEAILGRLGHDLHSFDFDSDQFRSLAPQLKHDILSELKDTRKQSSWGKLDQMPKDAGNFSNFQMERLLKRKKFQTSMDEVEAEITKRNTELLHMGIDLPGTISAQSMASRAGTYLVLSQQPAAAPASAPAPAAADGEMSDLSEEEAAALVEAADTAEYLAGADLFGGGGGGGGGSAGRVDRQLDRLVGRRSAGDEEDGDAAQVFSEMGKKYSNLYLTFSAQYVQDEKSSPRKRAAGVGELRGPPAGKKPAPSGSVPTLQELTGQLTRIPASRRSSASRQTEAKQPRRNNAEKTGRRPRTAASRRTAGKAAGAERKTVLSESASTQSSAAGRPGSSAKEQPVKLEERRSVESEERLSVKSEERRPGKSEERPSVKSENGQITVTVDPRTAPAEDDLFRDVFTASAAAAGHDSVQLMSDADDNGDDVTEKTFAVPATDSAQLRSDCDDGSKDVTGKTSSAVAVKDSVEFMSDSDDTGDEGTEKSAAAAAAAADACKTVTGQASSSAAAGGVSAAPRLKPDSDDSGEAVTVSLSDGEGVRSGRQPSRLTEIPELPAGRPDSGSDDSDERADPDDPRLPVSPRRPAGTQTATAAPDEADTAPDVADTAPDEAASAPDEAASAPDEADTAPDEADTAADEAVDEAASAPDEAAAALDEDVWGDLEDAELVKMAQRLAASQSALLEERGKQLREAATVSEQMYTEIQSLLELFGIPYVVSPQEAEAQCAFLEMAGLTEGTITDDSDIWLFGGKQVYKNFFNQKKFVERYQSGDIQGSLGLSRGQLICVALLTGSDYTLGVESVGCVRAVEILAEFPGQGLSGLRHFRQWWEMCRESTTSAARTPIRRSLAALQLSPGFPSEAVLRAYMEPEVDTSRQPFSWAAPDLDALRYLAAAKFGWGAAHTDNILLPMMERFQKRQGQRRLESFFQGEFRSAAPEEGSRRLREAVRRVRGEEPEPEPPITDAPPPPATDEAEIDRLMDDDLNQLLATMEEPVDDGGADSRRPAGAGRPAAGRARGRGRGSSTVGGKVRRSRVRRRPLEEETAAAERPASPAAAGAESPEMAALDTVSRERVRLVRRLRQRASLVSAQLRQETGPAPPAAHSRPSTRQVRARMMESLLAANPRLRLEREAQLRRRLGLPPPPALRTSCRDPAAGRQRRSFDQALSGETAAPADTATAAAETPEGSGSPTGKLTRAVPPPGNSGLAEPPSADSGPAEPLPANSGPAEPLPANSGPAEPLPANSGPGEPPSANSGPAEPPSADSGRTEPPLPPPSARRPASGRAGGGRSASAVLREVSAAPLPRLPPSSDEVAPQRLLSEQRQAAARRHAAQLLRGTARRRRQRPQQGRARTQTRPAALSESSDTD